MSRDVPVSLFDTSFFFFLSVSLHKKKKISLEFSLLLLLILFSSSNFFSFYLFFSSAPFLHFLFSSPFLLFFPFTSPLFFSFHLSHFSPLWAKSSTSFHPSSFLHAPVSYLQFLLFFGLYTLFFWPLFSYLLFNFSRLSLYHDFFIHHFLSLLSLFTIFHFFDFFFLFLQISLLFPPLLLISSSFSSSSIVFSICPSFLFFAFFFTILS